MGSDRICEVHLSFFNSNVLNSLGPGRWLWGYRGHVYCLSITFVCVRENSAAFAYFIVMLGKLDFVFTVGLPVFPVGTGGRDFISPYVPGIRILDWPIPFNRKAQTSKFKTVASLYVILNLLRGSARSGFSPVEKPGI